MGLRIRKSIKVAPGVRLNFGKKGISASIGKRGAGITVGPTGTTAHVGIPGTGISYVKKVGTTKTNVTAGRESATYQEKNIMEKQPKRGYSSCFVALIVLLGIGCLMIILNYGWSSDAIVGLVLFIVFGIVVLNICGVIMKNNDIFVGNSAIINEPTHANPVAKTSDFNSTPINPKEPFIHYKYPTISLLKRYEEDGNYINAEEQFANKNHIIKILGSFGIQIKTIRASVGPTITLYEMQLADGMLLSKVKEFKEDIALCLSAFGTRVIAPIPGKETFGIEIPNSKPKTVSVESVLSSSKFQETQMELPLALGKTVNNDVFMVDLADIPHLLIAGSAGQNASLGLDTILFSLLYKKHPNELKLVLIDLNKIELNTYSRIGNKFMAALAGEAPIVTDAKNAMRTLQSIYNLINLRYELFEKAGVSNIKEYSHKYINHMLKFRDGHFYQEYIVLIINELGDVVMTYGEKAKNLIVGIAKRGNAVGVHMIITTKRPTNSIVTDVIKDSIPGRISFRMGAECDSQVILGCLDANRLIGRGDMFYLAGNELIRLQCAYVDPAEIERVNEYISEQPGPIERCELPEPPIEGDNSLSNNDLDPLLEEAAYAIVSWQQGSTSMIQRRFSIGYNRAGRIMDQLEMIGVVGAAMGSIPREVLVRSIDELKLKLAKYKCSSYTARQVAPASSPLSGQTHMSERPKHDADLQNRGKESIVPNPLDALMNLIGLSSVKDELISMVNFIKLNKKRAEQGLPVTQIAYHCVFTGNPGTGKTTVARLLAGIFKELGVLKKGQLVETDRSGLVAEYIGQTAVKTNKIIDSALDGVLFIDEAYTLAQGGQDYGHEAIATLLKRMEDNRDRLIVILAGYGSEMKTFIESNPGLRSRFNRYINFPDYTSKELLAIFRQYLKRQQYVLSESALTQTMNFLTKEAAKGKSDFGNARFVRNLFEKAITQQANRLALVENCDKDMLKRIEEEDILKSIERM